MSNTKTLTRVTLPTGRTFILQKHRNGWPIPTSDDAGRGWVGGTNAYREACSRWIEEAGATIERVHNPHYRPRALGFAFSLR